MKSQWKISWFDYPQLYVQHVKSIVYHHGRRTKVRAYCGMYENERWEGLETNTSITLLNLSFNNTGPYGASMISGMKSLTDLFLNNNKIENDGLIALSKNHTVRFICGMYSHNGRLLLCTNTRLQRLQISHNTLVRKIDDNLFIVLKTNDFARIRLWYRRFIDIRL